MEPIGEGSQFQAFRHPHLEGEVIKISKENQLRGQTPTDMMGQYYLIKTLHLLVPQLIPDIHYAGIHSGHIVVRTDEVPVDEIYQEMSELGVKAWAGKLDEEAGERERLQQHQTYHEMRVGANLTYQDYKEYLTSLGLAEFFDLVEANIAVDVKDQPVFIDQVSPWTRSGENSYRGVNVTRLLQEIERQYPSDEKRKVQAQRYLDRYQKYLAQKNKQQG